MKNDLWDGRSVDEQSSTTFQPVNNQINKNSHKEDMNHMKKLKSDTKKLR